MDITTAVYEAENPVKPEKKFCAFIVRKVEEIVDRKKTGNMVPDQLPVVFWGYSAQEVDAKARTFWKEETEKVKAKAAHAKWLGEKRWKKSA